MDILFGNIRLAPSLLATVPLNLAPLLRCIVLVRQPALRTRLRLVSGASQPSHGNAVDMTVTRAAIVTGAIHAYHLQALPQAADPCPRRRAASPELPGLSVASAAGPAARAAMA
jgi:hypothetical protein